MYKDYWNDVVASYRKEEKKGSLPQRLMQPTPAQIKDECIAVIENRFDKKDFRTLTAFFKAKEDQQDLLRKMHKCDRDRFRPLVNFLNRDTSTTGHLNIELLAWLIDFQDRPFRPEYRGIGETEPVTLEQSDLEIEKNDSPRKNLTLVKEEKGVGDEIEEELEKMEEKESNERRRIAFPYIPKKFRIAAVGILILVSVSFSIIMDRQKQQCMTWVEDHYVASSCDSKSGTFLVPMDLKRLKYFKKIMRPDTISPLSIGRVFYLRRNGAIEYYTTGGTHPVDVTRTLQILTPYMYNQHIVPLRR